MGLQLKNDFLLVKELNESESEFASIDRTDKFEVAFTCGEYKKGHIVYIPSFYTEREVTIDGVKYKVAQASEVVAYVA